MVSGRMPVLVVYVGCYP